MVVDVKAALDNNGIVRMERRIHMLENYWLFVIMSLALIIMPGADVALVTKNTLTLGKRGGMATVFGITAGTLVHMLAAALGISAIIAQSAALFEIIKYIGAIYLIYLGVQSLLSLRKSAPLPPVVENGRKNSGSGFAQGLVSNVFNPKVAIFFLTFLPQFIVPGEHNLMQILIMGVTHAVLGVIWLTIYIYLIDAMRSLFQSQATHKVFQGVTGTMLLGLGIKLALEKR